jgi:riboflavin synthase
VHSFEPVGESRKLVIDAPVELGKFLAYKGSIVVNGVSLTVNSVEDLEANGGKVCRFSINLIPHTIAVTTLRNLHAGAKVNLEIDLIARYVERMLTAAKA